MPTAHRKALTEDAAYQPAATPERDAARVRELLKQGIVENVKVLGFASKNKNRRYREDGIDLAMFEGLACNVDHPHVANPNDRAEMDRAVGSPRPFIARFGKFEEPVKMPGDGVYYKRLRFNVKHPLAETFMGWVESMPEMIGFSPAQWGDVLEGPDGEYVEKVTQVKCIELVADPATTRGIFEAEQDDKDKPILNDDDLDDALADDDNALDDFDGESADPDPGDDEAGESAGIDITPEMFQSVTKIVQAFFDKKIDEAGAMAKIKQIFRTHAAIAESIMPNAQQPKTPAEAMKLLGRVAGRVKSPPVKKAIEIAIIEHRQHAAKAAETSKGERAKALMESAQLPADIAGDADFLAELMDCKDEKRMQSKIELWRKLFGTKRDSRPRSAGQVALTESERQEAENSFGGGATASLTDAERDKRIDEFSKRFSGAGSRS